MIAIIKRAAAPMVVALAATCSPALASSPLGVWYDHTGRGAVEITDCNGKLCGRIVWVKDANHKEGCGLQIFGDVKLVAGGKWDGGWIIDPEKSLKTRYDVEITPQGDKLKVMGYAGVKFLSETMMWTRAAPDLKRCDQTADRTPTPPNTVPNEPDEKPTNPSPRVVTPGPAPTPPPVIEEKPRTTARNGDKECKLQTPYFTIAIPCPE